MAIANGDLSLLFGAKLKREKEGKLEKPFFSWIPDLDTTLDDLLTVEEFGGQYFLRKLQFNDEGLSLIGDLWHIHF